VRILATQLRRLGVVPGDRVAAYLPNSPHAIIAMLATASIGAIWTSCGPDFGTRGVLDRFAQLAPKVLFCVDGYQYGGKPFNRRPELAQIIAGLDSLEQVVCLPYLNTSDRTPFSRPTVFWDDLLAARPVPKSEFKFEQVPFHTRCGSCSPPAPPDCPRPSSTARVASCWSSSRPLISRWT